MCASWLVLRQLMPTNMLKRLHLAEHAACFLHHKVQIEVAALVCGCYTALMHDNLSCSIFVSEHDCIGLSMSVSDVWIRQAAFPSLQDYTLHQSSAGQGPLAH